VVGIARYPIARQKIARYSLTGNQSWTGRSKSKQGDGMKSGLYSDWQAKKKAKRLMSVARRLLKKDPNSCLATEKKKSAESLLRFSKKQRQLPFKFSDRQ
jgi:hypothetical protein